MPAIVDKDSMRQQIRRGFEAALEEKQLAQISMRDVAAKVGISHQRIYYYYKNKEALIRDYISGLAELSTSEAYRWKDKITARPGITAEWVIGTLIEVVAKINYEKGHTRALIQIYAYGEYDPSVKDIIKTMYKKWEEMLADVLFSVTNREMTQEAAAILALIEGMFVYTLNSGYCRDFASGLLQRLKHIYDV